MPSVSSRFSLSNSRFFLRAATTLASCFFINNAFAVNDLYVNEDSSATHNIPDNYVGWTNLGVDNQPDHGSLQYINEIGYTYTPIANYCGSDRFIYEMRNNGSSGGSGSGGSGGSGSGGTGGGGNPPTQPLSAPIPQLQSEALSNTVTSLTPTASPATPSLKNNLIATTTSGYVETVIVDITVRCVNDAPTISSIGNKTINEDGSTTVYYTVADIDANDPASSLTISRSSNNASILGSSNMVVGGSGASRSLTLTPKANSNGTATVYVTVSDGEISRSESFVLTVNPVNDAPTITSISNKSTNEDVVKNVGFTVNDVETSASSLIITKSSNNQSLLPNANLVVSGSGGSRTLSLTPASNKYGSAIVTVSVSDGSKVDTETFTLTVNSVNDTPVMNAIGTKQINEDSVSNFSITISDVETQRTSLSLSATSSNSALIPASNIVFNNTAASTTVAITPVANKYGSANITLKVSDGVNIGSRVFAFNVQPVNDAPVIGEVSNVKTLENTAGTINVDISDLETPANGLTLTATSSNSTLLKASGISITQTGGTRTVTLTPENGASGNSSIELTLSDGQKSVQTNFNFSVKDTFSVSNIEDNDYQLFEKNGIYYVRSEPTWVPIAGDVFIIIPIYEEGDILKLTKVGGVWRVDNIQQDEFLAANPALVSDSFISNNDINSDGNADLTINLGSIGSNEQILYLGESNSSLFTLFTDHRFATKGGFVADANLNNVNILASDFVGATPGQGGVSGGAASYQVPITVVPGRAGMQPNVSLSYSSRSGSGVAGVGWSLNAGGAISRCSSTVAQDGEVGGVTLNTATDKLCLNGQRLMKADNNSTYGNANVEYRFELDNFTIVKQIGGNLDSLSTYFEVTYADGSKEFYGNETDSRVVPSGTGKALSWLLTKKEDISGNNMVYTYVSPYDNEFLLTHIEYTGFENTVGTRKVSFGYDDLAKQSTRYIAGGKLRTTRRLKLIRTYDNGTRVRDYNLAYETSGASGRSLLKSVTECADLGVGGLACREPLNFEWSDNAVVYKLERLVTQQGDEIIDMGKGGEILKHIPQGDMDGNGIRDWPTIHVDAELNKLGNNTADIQQCRRNSLSLQLQCVNGDFNNDGRTDNWRIVNERLQIGLSNGTSFSWLNATDIVMRDNKNTWGVLYDTIANISDYNGDGWADIVVHEATQQISPRTGYQSVGGELYVYHHTGNVNNPYTSNRKVQLISLQTNESIQYTGDMDNDGLPDFAISKRMNNNSLTRITDFLFSRVDQNNNLALDRVPFYIPQDNDQLWDDFGMLVDVNSDGLPDWIGLIAGEGMKLHVKINKGDRSFAWHAYLGYSLPQRDAVNPDKNPNEPGVLQSPKYINAIKQVDMDGDGRTELIIPHLRVISRCTRVEISNGSRPYRCGDEIYNTFAHGNHLRSQSTEYDNSTYQYKALKFIETSSNGIESYSIQSEQTSILATAESSFAIDGFGKGLADIVFFNGCNTSQCKLEFGESASIAEDSAYFVRNYGAATTNTPGDNDYRAIDLLQSVNNTIGMRSEWQYHPLTSSQPDDFYYADHAKISDYDHFLFASSMYAVSSFKQSNGLADQMNERQYRYENAMYNNQGRGFRGFETIIETDVENQTRTETDFKQKFPFSSLIAEQRVYSIADDNNNPFQTTSNQWVYTNSYSSPADGMVRVHNHRNESARYNLLNTTERLSLSVTTVAQNDIDAWGNVERRVTQVTDGSGGEGFGTYTTTETKVFDPSDSWPHKLISSTVAKVYSPSANVPNKHSSTGLNKTVSTKIDTWNLDHRKPGTITVAGGSTPLNVNSCNTGGLNGCTATVTVYNSFGLPTDVEITGAKITGLSDQVGLETRTTSTTYTTDGYFPEDISVDSGSFVHTQTVETDSASGAPTLTTDANGLTVRTIYDSFLRPIEVIAQGAPTQYIRYHLPDSNSPNDDAVMMVTTYQAGAPESHEYKDILGRTLRKHTLNLDGSDIYTDVRYDSLGRTIKESTPHAGTPIYTEYNSFDALGRPGNKVTPSTDLGEDVTTTYIYNGLTTNISTSAPEGDNLNLSRTHNSMGQLMNTVDANGGVTEYAYDAAGNPIVIKDAVGNSIYANYDNLGRKTWVRDPNQGLTSFVYNDFGELEKETDANNEIMRYELDKLGRLTKRYSPDGNAEFEWDTLKLGLLSSEELTNGAVSKLYSYDGLARPIEVVTTIDSETYSVKTEYDENYGRPKAIEYPNKLKVAFEYNDLGYLTHEKNAASGYVYRRVTEMDVFGNTTSSDISNGELTGRYQFSSSTGQMLFSKVMDGTNAIHFLDYQNYDSYGNILTQSNLVAGINSTDTFAYDSLHRMMQSSTVGGAGSGTIAATIDYSYDAVGNMKSKSDFSTTSENAYTYQAGSNRLMSVALKGGGTATFGYDNKGNQTQGTNATFTYNVFNKPTYINRFNSQTSLYYDANWSRYKQVRVVEGKTITTHYIDKMYEVEFENSLSKTSSYISDVAILIEENDNAKIRFTHKDRLGSTATFTDHLGNVTAYRSYDPFGKPKMGNGSFMFSFDLRPRLSNNLLDSDQATRRGFTDHEHLDEVEIIHMNGRVYDYNVGRFMGVDPFIQEAWNSQSINPYSYILNNPLSGTDPSGYSRIRGINGGIYGGMAFGFGGPKWVKRQDSNGSSGSGGIKSIEKIVDDFLMQGLPNLSGDNNSSETDFNIRIDNVMGIVYPSATSGNSVPVNITNTPSFTDFLENTGRAATRLLSGISSVAFAKVGLLLSVIIPLNETVDENGIPLGQRTLDPLGDINYFYTDEQIKRLREAHDAGLAYAAEQIKNNTGKKTVLIGESQNKRVIPAAQFYKAQVIGAPPEMIIPGKITPGSFNEMVTLTYNVAWVQGFKNAGYTFLDIGIDKGREERSIYYQAEKFTLTGYNKVQQIAWD